VWPTQPGYTQTVNRQKVGARQPHFTTTSLPPSFGCCCCSTQRARMLSGPNSGPPGTGAAIAMDGGMADTACYYTLAVNRRGAGKGVSGNPSPASHEFNDSRRLIASVENPKVSGSAWGSVDRPVDTFGRSEARLLSYKPCASVSQSVSSRSPRALTTPPSQRRRPRTSPGSTQSRVRPPTTPPGLRGEGS
jgi:hypothetical protein